MKTQTNFSQCLIFLFYLLALSVSSKIIFGELKQISGKKTMSNSTPDFSDQLREDFLFLLDMLRKPEQAFPPCSPQLLLAQKWLDFLCTYKFDTLEDKRLRNMYMSHLCTGLIQSKLYGPFLGEPPLNSKLTMVDFSAEPETNASAEILQCMAEGLDYSEKFIQNDSMYGNYTRPSQNATEMSLTREGIFFN